MQITSGVLSTPLKVVIYGPEGIGKSTFAAQAPGPLFIDTEGSTSRMNVRRLPAPTSFTMIQEEIRYVISNPTVCQTLVLDTADWAERLCRDGVCSKNSKSGLEDFGYGKGYTYVYEDFGRMLNLLDQVTDRGINVIVNAHAAMRKFEQPDESGAYDRWELKLINALFFSKVATTAKALEGYHSSTAAGDWTKENVYPKLKAMLGAGKLKLYKSKGALITYVASYIMDLLEQSTDFTRSIEVTAVADGGTGLETRITDIDGVPVMEVIDDELPPSTGSFRASREICHTRNGLNWSAA